jgi:hypothetical protein
MGNLVLTGATSGSITLEPTAVAGSNTITLPANTGTLLTTGSTGQVIPKAALPTGSVLQVVNATYSTQTTTTSTSYVTTNITASITPTSSSSKIYVVTSFAIAANTANLSAYFTLYRNSSEITSPQAFRFEHSSTPGGSAGAVITYLDSPATTSSTTYTVYMKTQSASLTIYSCLSSSPASITLMEIAA